MPRPSTPRTILLVILACAGLWVLSGCKAPALAQPTPTSLPLSLATRVPITPASAVPASPTQRDTTVLRPSSDLQSACLPWLTQPISRSSRAQLKNGLGKGDAAVDFTLETAEGRAIRLGDLLEDKPVLLVLGGFT